jgi:hypothetical protein
MVEQLTPRQLVDVLRAERRRRWQTGDRVLAEAFLQRYPELQSDSNLATELIYHEVLLREELGERPDVREYVSRFPHLAP